MRIVLALLAALSFSGAFAAPFAVQVGDTRLALDPPPGFADAQFTGSPRLIELAESMTAASNRILLFALEDADLRRFTVGDSPVLRRSVLVVTPRSMQRESLSLAEFKAFAAESLGDTQGPPRTSDLRAYLDARPAAMAHRIARLRSDPEVASMLEGSRLAPTRAEEPPRYLVSTQTLMLLRGKALALSVFTHYESPADLDWLRAATARWIDELQRLNGR